MSKCKECVLDRGIFLDKHCLSCRNIAVKRATIHIAAAIAWGPLAWAIGGDLIIFYLGETDYFKQLRWGIAASGVLFNLYRALQNVIKTGLFAL